MVCRNMVDGYRGGTQQEAVSCSYNRLKYGVVAKNNNELLWRKLTIQHFERVPRVNMHKREKRRVKVARLYVLMPLYRTAVCAQALQQHQLLWSPMWIHMKCTRTSLNLTTALRALRCWSSSFVGLINMSTFGSSGLSKSRQKEAMAERVNERG